MSNLRVSFGCLDGLRWARAVFRVSRGSDYNLVHMEPLDVLILGYAGNRKSEGIAKS